MPALKKRFYQSFIVILSLVILSLYQNCGKPSESGANNQSLSDNNLGINFLVSALSKANLHGPSGELLSSASANNTQFIASFTDSNTDGIEDVLAYSYRSAYNTTNNTTRYLDRKIAVRSGSNLSVIRHHDLPEYTLNSGVWSEFKVLAVEDINGDQIKDVFLFMAFNSNDNTFPDFQNFSDFKILSGFDFSEIAQFRIDTTRALFVYDQADIFSDSKKEIIFTAYTSRQNYTLEGFYIIDLSTDQPDVRFIQAPLIVQNANRVFNYDYNRDGKNDAVIINHETKQLQVYSLVNAQGLLRSAFFMVNSLNLAPFYEGLSEGYGHLVGIHGDGFPSLMLIKMNRMGIGFNLGLTASVYDLETSNSILEIEPPDENKFFQNLYVTTDLNQNGSVEIMFVQRDIRDIAEINEKVGFWDPKTNSIIYSITPPIRDAVNYGSAAYGIVLKNENP